MPTMDCCTDSSKPGSMSPSWVIDCAAAEVGFAGPGGADVGASASASRVGAVGWARSR
jgi:hypothetical protein